jgi:8-oxo-dGTP diphosphatase
LGGPPRLVGRAPLTDLSGADIVQVAAAVILRADGRFLLSQRPPGKVYAGYWEFPGGKVEPGEPLADALARELHEELGIEVTRAYPWIAQRYVYPHAHVQLNFFRVLGWSGQPRPREDQALAWAALHDLGVTPLLPANGPVLRALALPDRLGITRAHEVGIEPFLQRLDAALADGLRMVMVREKRMPGTRLAAFACEVVRRCHAAGAKALIHGDAQLAVECGADGVHLPAAALLHAPSRPQAGLCGASCHDAAELEHAQRLGLDYAVLGAVLPTASHPGQPAMGWERFAQLAAGCVIPVYALGGMQALHLERAWRAGAHGIAMMRAAWAG